MPTYDYECNGCGHTFELFQSINESPKKTCPECRKPKLRRLFGTGAALVFKGSGFYQTDYRSEGYKKAAAADKPASESTSSTKSEGASESKSEAKSESPPAAKGEGKSERKKGSRDSKRRTDYLVGWTIPTRSVVLARICCPICHRPFDSEQSSAMPFCSDRCRRIDLGRWLRESYGMPVERSDEEQNSDCSDSGE